jgi:hypothetical protein
LVFCETNSPAVVETAARSYGTIRVGCWVGIVVKSVGQVTSPWSRPFRVETRMGMRLPRAARGLPGAMELNAFSVQGPSHSNADLGCAASASFS